MARPRGAKNKRTVLAMEDCLVAQRALARLYGSDMEAGGIAKSIPHLLWEMTRNTYDNTTRIAAAKELARLRYAAMAPLQVDKTGEPVEAKQGAPEQLAMPIELWTEQDAA